MRKSVIASAVSVVVVLNACTSLKSLPTVSESQNFTPKGLTYRLPAKQLTINTTYEIKDCTPTGSDPGVIADVKVTMTESLVGDTAYTINYEDLNAITKVTNTEFHISGNGLLTGVNASIVDQSATIIKNSAETVAGIARATESPRIL